jgi:hypothetical protein
MTTIVLKALYTRLSTDRLKGLNKAPMALRVHEPCKAVIRIHEQELFPVELLSEVTFRERADNFVFD